ncbi:MAG TPA: class III lanthionine synthetase LanKC [Actinomycetes bacterium]
MSAPPRRSASRRPDATRYLPFCAADPDFYEPLERLPDQSGRFALADQPVPAGWERRERGVWVGLRPAGADLPDQGWKLHVSATPQDAEAVLRTAWDYCLDHWIAFKFLRSYDVMLQLNGKYADRGASGKLVTVYPADGGTLERAATDLAAALDGVPGPYVLSDLRFGHGPVYLRFGAFRERYLLGEDGRQVAALRAPDGRLVPDGRRPVFQLPPWVEVPTFLAPHLAARQRDGPQGFPYDVEGALHYSNGGGVYVAREKRGGRRVVLKEARPLAGLDPGGRDAVARLHHEGDVLERLAGLDAVPRLLDRLTYWEHHYLVQEYVEGESLHRWIAGSYPLTRPDPSDQERAAYAAQALELLRRVEDALRAMHRRRVVFGDLHPRNVLVRPDGRVVLVDFELAFQLGEARLPVLGAPGFAARPGTAGVEIDRHALDRLRLAMFLPLTVLVDRDPGKGASFARAATERFPLPARFARRLQRSFPAAEGPGAADGAGGWRALAEALRAGILASATPERPDRLFPGDVEQFGEGGIGLAHGAAGVLFALSLGGAAVDPDQVDWLASATRQVRHPRPGLYDGLHGAAHVLWRLGRREAALATLERALACGQEVRSAGLSGGLAGIALNLLHFARLTGDRSLRGAALDAAGRLGRRLGERAGDHFPQPGLLHGGAGVALLFVHLYELDREPDHLDLAKAALRLDLERCRWTPDGTLQVDDGSRLLPYLATGSAGIGLVLSRFLRHRRDDELVAAVSGVRRACQAEFVLQAGLFGGRAGLIACLAALRDLDGAGDGALELHLARLGWHAMPYGDHLAVPGEFLLRLSMDLATGSAGVLLAVLAAGGDPAARLPFLDGGVVAEAPAPDTREGGDGDGVRAGVAGPRG